MRLRCLVQLVRLGFLATLALLLLAGRFGSGAVARVRAAVVARFCLDRLPGVPVRQCVEHPRSSVCL